MAADGRNAKKDKRNHVLSQLTKAGLSSDQIRALGNQKRDLESKHGMAPYKGAVKRRMQYKSSASKAPTYTGEAKKRIGDLASPKNPGSVPRMAARGVKASQKIATAPARNTVARSKAQLHLASNLGEFGKNRLKDVARGASTIASSANSKRDNSRRAAALRGKQRQIQALIKKGYSKARAEALVIGR